MMQFQWMGEMPEFNNGIISGSQAPAPSLEPVDGEWRIYFSARDKSNRSHIVSWAVDPAAPWGVIGNTTQIDLGPGNIGEFDETGAMVSQVDHHNRGLWYTGWNKSPLGSESRFRTACGTHCFTDRRGTLFNGPREVLIDRLSTAPCGTSMPFLSMGRVYYMAVQKWERSEPFYDIWSISPLGCDPQPEIGLKEGEGGLARPVIYRDPKDRKLRMFYSYRAAYDYRTDPDKTYKIGMAEKEWWDINPNFYDDSWHRRDDCVDIILPEGRRDFMQAYPYVINTDTGTWMFYNNTFQSRIQVAKLI